MQTKVRQGPGVLPTTSTAGTTGASARLVIFRMGVRPCILYNASAVTCTVKINGTDADPADASDYDVAITAGGLIDLSLGGQVAIYTVSFYMASGSYDSIRIRGWEP